MRGLLGFDDIKPARREASPEEVRAGDEAAARVGYVSREPTAAMPLKRRRPVEEPTFSFTARVSLRSGNRFIEWCERERLTYREGFDRLVALIDKAEDHR
jgi:hypothetical protein